MDESGATKLLLEQQTDTKQVSRLTMSVAMCDAKLSRQSRTWGATYLAREMAMLKCLAPEASAVMKGRLMSV